MLPATHEVATKKLMVQADDEHKCAAGHTLIRWRNRTKTLRCDGACGKRLGEGSYRWSCKLCDFDVCEECCVCPSVLLNAPGSATPQLSSCRSGTAAVSERAPAPFIRPPSRPCATPTIAGAPVGTPLVEDTGAATGQGASLLCALTGLASVKRDLDDAFPGSADSAPSDSPLAAAPRAPLTDGKPAAARAAHVEAGTIGLRLAGVSAKMARHQRPRAAAAGQWLSLPCLELQKSGGSPDLFAALPPLVGLGLPAPVSSRMFFRRAWLQRLLEDELGRVERAVRGELSALEVQA
jgi:hypothetical protein